MKQFLICLICSSSAGFSLGNSLPVDYLDQFPQNDSQIYYLERSFSEVLVANYDNGGAYQPSAPLISLEGNSLYHTQYFVNSIPVNSFLRPGQPLLWLPTIINQNVSIKSAGFSRQENRGIQYSIDGFDQPDRLKVSFVNAVGGPHLIPENTFDREPATSWGASPAANMLQPSGNLQYLNAFQNALSALQVQAGNRVYADRTTERYLTSNAYLYLALAKSEFLSVGSSIQWREDESNESLKTQPASELYYSYVNGYSKIARDHRFDLQLSFESIEQAASNGVQQTELLDIFDNRLFQPSAKEMSVNLNLQVQQQAFEGAQWSGLYLFNMNAKTLHSNKEAVTEEIFYSEQALQVSQYKAANYDILMLDIAPAFRAHYEQGRVSASVEAGLYTESSWGGDDQLLQRAVPEGTLHFEYAPSASSAWYFNLNRVAVPNQRLFLEYLHPHNQEYAKSWWADDGDNHYEAGEKQQLLQAGGGDTESASGSGPVQNEIAIGYKFDDSRSSWHLRMLARQTLNTWKMRFTDTYLSNFSTEEVEFEGETVQLYDLQSGFGDETYELTVDKEPVNQIGFTLNHQQNRWRPFFAGFSFTALLSMGKTGLGLNSIYNDWGYSKYMDADPNFINNLEAGRLDQDRSYFLHLFAGLMFKHFSWTNILQYRDGQPVARMNIIDGLSQGPVFLQSGSYANGITGIGRTALFLNWDMRFLYRYANWVFSLDIYNVLNSRFESAELLRNGPDYRQPVGILAERSIQLGVETTL